ncbi:MAG: type II toxin-antitoxin system Phd/YefM family antitoxin [Propionibacteriaceae bacterium]|jgi:prevent-host-death family protein|nr:type II toxin-antitoxin system Phd/YefM family antitoxin [Propionibacteriaceae bacterium]
MTFLTATEASRGFRAMLDAVERNESFTITRDNRPIAEVIPIRQNRFGDLVQALDKLPRDTAWADETESLVTVLNAAEWENPWFGN